MKKPKIKKPIFRKLVFLLLIICLAALSLRIYRLDYENFWTDEAETIYYDQHGSIYEVAKTSFENAYVPLYDVILSRWMLLFGVSEFGARLFSAVIGITSVIVIYFLGTIIFSSETGIISALILSLSSFHVYYSQEARSYALLFLLSLLSFYFLIKHEKFGKTRHLAYYSGFTFLMLVTHAFSIFAVIAQNIYFIAVNGKSQKKIKNWIVCQFFIAAAALPFYYYWYSYGLRYFYDTWIPKPGIRDLVKTFYIFSAGETNTSVSLVLGGVLSLIFGFLMLYSIYSVLKIMPRTKFWSAFLAMPNFQNLILLLAWLFVPVVLIFIFSIASNPIFSIRYFIYSSAPLYLLASFSLSKFSKIKKILFLSAIILLMSFILFMDFTTINKEPWPGVAQYLKRNSNQNSAVFVNTPTSIYALSFYLDKGCFQSKDIKGCLASKNIYGVRNSAGLPLKSINGKDVFLILFNSRYVDKNNSLADYFTRRYEMLDKKEFDGIEIYHFG